MKIFAIRDENDKSNKNLALLFYYEKEKQFCIELPENADPWETPLLLSTFAKKGIKTVSAYFSRLWVQQRIVPQDRQNLGQILKENGLECYDEYELLMLANGRCAQDDYYLVPLSKDEVPEEYVHRAAYKVDDVLPLPGGNLMVFFRNGEVRKCDIHVFFEDKPQFSVILEKEELFRKVGVIIGGHGVRWDEHITISDESLYEGGEKVPLKKEDFLSFIDNRVINTAEAAELLGCSRQNIDDLVKRDKLHPIKVEAKNKWFLKTEVLQRKWE